MDILSFINGFSGLGGTAQGMGGASQANPWSAAQQGSGQSQWGQGGGGGQQQPQWGMEALQQGPQMLQQVQQQAEFGTQGMPPSLQAQLAQEQGQQQGAMQQMSQPNFNPYVQQGSGVLPLPGELEQARQSVPMMGSDLQSQPVGLGSLIPMQVGPGHHTASQRPTQGQLGAAPPVADQGFNPFNFTGTASSDPSNTNPVDPNMFLRMSEGYNRGGLLGALGMLLTDYK